VARSSGAPATGSSPEASPPSPAVSSETRSPGPEGPKAGAGSPESAGAAPPPFAPPYQPLAPFQAIPSRPYAAWALVVGVSGLICFGAGPILGLIAIVLGVLGWRQVTKAGGAMRGRFSAGAGIAAGFLSIVFFVGEVALFLSLHPSKLAA